MPFVSVNLSGDGFSDGRVVRDIKDALSKTGLDPSLVRIELTEGVLSDNPEIIKAMLTGLNDLGVEVALDDFGTGFSNMSNLVQFPISALKIDRAFVHSMLLKDESLDVVRAIINTAHSLDMVVMAEGVETVEQLHRLWQMGCEYGQGFLMSQPLSEEDALAFASKGPVLTRGPVLLHKE